MEPEVGRIEGVTLALNERVCVFVWRRLLNGKLHMSHRHCDAKVAGSFARKLLRMGATFTPHTETLGWDAELPEHQS